MGWEQASLCYNRAGEIGQTIVVVGCGQASLCYNLRSSVALVSSLWVAGRRYSVTIGLARLTYPPRSKLWVAGRRHSVTIMLMSATPDLGLWVAGRRHSVTIGLAMIGHARSSGCGLRAGVTLLQFERHQRRTDSPVVGCGQASLCYNHAHEYHARSRVVGCGQASLCYNSRHQRRTDTISPGWLQVGVVGCGQASLCYNC